MYTLYIYIEHSVWLFKELKFNIFELVDMSCFNLSGKSTCSWYDDSVVGFAFFPITISTSVYCILKVVSCTMDKNIWDLAWDRYSSLTHVIFPSCHVWVVLVLVIMCMVLSWRHSYVRFTSASNVTLQYIQERLVALIIAGNKRFALLGKPHYASDDPVVYFSTLTLKYMFL